MAYNIFNIYCDESCHLINDKDSNIMAISGLMCPKDKYDEVKNEINRIKSKYNISKNTELKWTKISTRTRLLFLDLVELFFQKQYLEFRIVIINKNQLTDTDDFDQFYDKMCYLLLRYMLPSYSMVNIYLDKKDTKGYHRIKVLKNCLERIRTNYDINTTKINNLQNVHSNEIPIMELTDILMGAMVYFARGLNKVSAKNDIIDYIKQETGLSLTKTTPLTNHKFNILYFKSEYMRNEVL